MSDKNLEFCVKTDPVSRNVTKTLWLERERESSELV
jgi:hypothetical protein